MSDIKAELRLIREKCPTVWKKFISLAVLDTCPNCFELADSCYGDCEACWDKAIESEVKAE